jgi:PAS domain S-box-containing protein
MPAHRLPSSWGLSPRRRRRRAEDALHEVKELFESAFSAAPIAMALVGLTPDTAGRALQVNAALCELLGYPADALTRMSVLDVTHREDAALFSERPTEDIERFSGLKRYLREPGLELPSRPRVVQARPGLEPVHALSLVRSDEYPRFVL